MESMFATAFSSASRSPRQMSATGPPRPPATNIAPCETKQSVKIGAAKVVGEMFGHL